MSDESQVYRDLQRRLDQLPTGYAELPSGIEIRLLKRLFTPQEALIATKLSMKPETVKRIYPRLKKSGLSIGELEKLLDEMFLKGLILRDRKDDGDEKLYSNAKFSAGGIFDIQVGRLNKGLVEDFEQYFGEMMQAQFAAAAKDAEAKAAAGKGAKEDDSPKPLVELRTVPVMKSIPHPEKYPVSRYDDVRKIIENSTAIAVTKCICRLSKDELGQNCKKTDMRETCIILTPKHVRQYLDMGIGRAITKEEALAILEKTQADGLIPQPANSKDPDVIYNCCGDCCQFISTVKRAPRPVDFFATNYYATVAPELCKGCQKCLERCQMEARVMSDGVATVNLDRCIGCGNCVVICSSGASQLKKKEEEVPLPKDAQDLYMKILGRRVGKWNIVKTKIKMFLGMRA